MQVKHQNLDLYLYFFNLTLTFLIFLFIIWYLKIFSIIKTIKNIFIFKTIYFIIHSIFMIVFVIQLQDEEFFFDFLLQRYKEIIYDIQDPQAVSNALGLKIILF